MNLYDKLLDKISLLGSLADVALVTKETQEQYEEVLISIREIAFDTLKEVKEENNGINK